MLPAYDLIGKKITLWNGNIHVLSVLLATLSNLIGVTLWFVLAGEWDVAAELSAWKAMTGVFAGSLILTRALSRLIYRPLPPDGSPESASRRGEGMRIAILASMPFLEIDGIGGDR